MSIGLSVFYRRILVIAELIEFSFAIQLLIGPRRVYDYFSLSLKHILCTNLYNKVQYSIPWDLANCGMTWFSFTGQLLIGPGKVYNNFSVSFLETYFNGEILAREGHLVVYYTSIQCFIKTFSYLLTWLWGFFLDFDYCLS